MAILHPDLVIRLIFVFWIAAQVGHFIGFIIANHDDIYINWKKFYLGDLLSWVIIGLISWWLASENVSEWIYWIYYLVHWLLISTVFSDIALNQDTFSLMSSKDFIIENLKESILIPWIVGIIFGFISILIFGI